MLGCISLTKKSFFFYPCLFGNLIFPGTEFLLSGGKSSVLMDIKPWDDETDMKKLEELVRKVEVPGLLWGACTFHFCYCCGASIRQF